VPKHSLEAPPLGYERLETEMKKRALRALVRRRVLLDAAREQYVMDEQYEVVLDAFAEEQLRKFEARIGSRLKARVKLSEMGLTAAQYRKLQVDNALVSQLLWEKVYSDISIAPAEVRQYYVAHRDEFQVPAVLAYRQILFAVVEPADVPQMQTRAAAVLREIEGGAGFALMADRYSADRDAYPGGLHEVKLPEDNLDWRPQAVEGLEVGQISAVRQVTGGYAIVKFERLTSGRVLTFTEAQARIEQDLLARRRMDAEEAYAERLEGKALVDYYPAAKDLGL